MRTSMALVGRLEILEELLLSSSALLLVLFESPLALFVGPLNGATGTSKECLYLMSCCF